MCFGPCGLFSARTWRRETLSPSLARSTVSTRRPSRCFSRGDFRGAPDCETQGGCPRYSRGLKGAPPAPLTLDKQVEPGHRRQAQGGVSGQVQVKKDGPNQDTSKVAGYPVMGFNFFECGDFLRANIFPETAARMEAASRRRLDGTGNIPL